MPITSLPIVGEGEALGPTKSDRRAVTSTSTQVAASEWNASAVAVAAVTEEVGLTTAPAAASIGAERLKNATEIAEALADGDYIPIANVSDTSVQATGTVRKTLLSRLWTYVLTKLAAISEGGVALAGADSFFFYDVTDSTIKRSTLDRIGTFLLAYFPIAWGTWTPTTTLTTNLDAATASVGMYLRVGSITIAGVKLSIDATAASAIELGISLPVASNFSDSTQLFGVLTGAMTAGRIFSDATNDRAQAYATATSTAAVDGGAIFVYRVI
jgi:hypothetical protein